MGDATTGNGTTRNGDFIPKLFFWIETSSFAIWTKNGVGFYPREPLKFVSEHDPDFLEIFPSGLNAFRKSLNMHCFKQRLRGSGIWEHENGHSLRDLGKHGRWDCFPRRNENRGKIAPKDTNTSGARGLVKPKADPVNGNDKKDDTKGNSRNGCDDSNDDISWNTFDGESWYEGEYTWSHEGGADIWIDDDLEEDQITSEEAPLMEEEIEQLEKIFDDNSEFFNMDEEMSLDDDEAIEHVFSGGISEMVTGGFGVFGERFYPYSVRGAAGSRKKKSFFRRMMAKTYRFITRMSSTRT